MLAEAAESRTSAWKCFRENRGICDYLPTYLGRGQIFIHARIHSCVNLGKVFVRYLDSTKNRCSGIPQRNGKRYLVMELASLMQSFKELMMKFQEQNMNL